MNTSILGDKIIVLWQVLLAGGAVVFSVTFGAWLMGRKWRKNGEQPPSLARRVAVCTTVSIAALLGLPAAFGILGTLKDGGIPCVTLPGAAIVIGCIVIARRLVNGWSRSVKASVLIIVFLCGISGTTCFYATLGRFQTLAKRVIDACNLKSIGHGLVFYHAEYDAYPDDLRRLVDAHTTSADVLRSIYGSERPTKPRTVPYDGPCDFIYIRLPDDAPDNLVWVWQPVKYHDNEGGHVLLKDTGVRWMQAEKLKAEVARTHKWLEAHPSTQP